MAPRHLPGSLRWPLCGPGVAVLLRDRPIPRGRGRRDYDFSCTCRAARGDGRSCASVEISLLSSWVLVCWLSTGVLGSPFVDRRRRPYAGGSTSSTADRRHSPRYLIVGLSLHLSDTSAYLRPTHRTTMDDTSVHQRAMHRYSMSDPSRACATHRYSASDLSVHMVPITDPVASVAKPAPNVLQYLRAPVRAQRYCSVGATVNWWEFMSSLWRQQRSSPRLRVSFQRTTRPVRGTPTRKKRACRIRPEGQAGYWRRRDATNRTHIVSGGETMWQTVAWPEGEGPGQTRGRWLCQTTHTSDDIGLHARIRGTALGSLPSLVRVSLQLPGT
jgi:hypothetical protein